jgi:hypothetical protein
MHSIDTLPPAGRSRGCVRASLASSPIHPHRSAGRTRFEKYPALCAVFLLITCVLPLALSGCGSIESNAATVGTLGASTGTLAFGNVTVGQTASNTITLKNDSVAAVQITQISVAGQSFALTSQTAVPMTLAAAGSLTLNLQFNPAAAGAASGKLTVLSNAASGTVTVSLTGTGTTAVTTPPPPSPVPPTVSAIACSSSTITGAGTDNCTVTLSAAVDSSGGTVNLSSNDSAAVVPATVAVAPNMSSASFSVTAAAVSAAQTAIITAAMGSSSATFNLQLNPLPSSGGTPAMSVSASNLAFGNITVNTQATPQFVTVLSTGTAPLTVSAATASGAGFSTAGPGFPITLNPGSTVTLQVNFTPVNTGTATGSLTVTSDAPTGGTAVVALSGNGTAPVPTGTPAMSLSASTLSFGDVTVNDQATPQFVTVISTGTAPLIVSAATASGAGFSVSGPALPITLNPGNAFTLQVNFSPTSAGAATGSLTVASDAPTGGTAVVALNGTGDAAAGVLNGLFCDSSTITGAGTDNCTVSLTAPAPAGGLAVSLSSSNSALTVPSGVTVAAGNTNAFFTATATAVTSNATANVTASAGGASKIYAVRLLAQNPALSASTTTLNFGDVSLNTTTTQPVTLTSTGSSAVTINSGTLAGAGFSMTGATFPLTLNPGQTATLQVSFDPTTAGAANGSITFAGNASNGTIVISLSGNGQSAAGVLSSLSCTNQTLTGAGTDPCSVTLSGAAPIGGQVVTLSSNSSSVTVPGSVTVPAGSTSVSFNATVALVTSSTSATLSAASGGSTKVFTLQLNAQTMLLSVSTTNLAFGDVTVGTPASQPVTLTSSGTSPVTINTATLTGTGFSMTGVNPPVTLNPGQTVTLQVTFNPATPGAATGSILITTNATTNPTANITLSGTGDAAAGALSSLTCTTSSYTAAGTDACTVTLGAAAGTGGLAVTLASNNASVTVPTSVTVPAGATTATFNATVAAVSSTQTATLTATASGVAKTFAIQLSGAPGLTVSSTTLAFGNVNLNTPTNKSVTLTSSGTAPLTISAATLTGTGFSMTGATFPVTLNSGQAATLQVTFNPTVAGAATGSIAITSNAATNPNPAIALSGTGIAPVGVLSSLTCATSSYNAAGTDACSVTLSAAAGTGGFAVTLASSNGAVTVPASVTVPAGSTTASFNAAVTAVTSTQTATLTASAGGVVKTFAIQLTNGAPGLTLSSTTVAFGNVNLNTPSTQTVTLRSSGGSAVTISAATITGAGFTMSGLTLPLTLNPGQTAVLNLQFDPTTAGAATGSVTITSNATTGATQTIALTGTGVNSATYEVQLSWTAPASSADPVVSYNIYRSTGAGTYRKLNTAVNTPTSYTDTTVQSGVTYNYEVTSVDGSGVESTPSNVYTAVIP